MEFRPCIDIHNGKVKQIVGSSLKDQGNSVVENYVSDRSSDRFARLFCERKLKGGHIILLNAKESEFYDLTKKAALKALTAYPSGMQVGGGIDPENAEEFLKAGASHVIVTSYVFSDGQIQYDHLRTMKETVGKEHLVLDLSCRKKGDCYYIVTNRWQKYTDVMISSDLLTELKAYCDEFLIHAVDVEGKNSGIDETLIKIISEETENPVTYAGGVHELQDIWKIAELSKARVNVTVGSALELFGGRLSLDDLIKETREANDRYDIEKQP